MKAKPPATRIAASAAPARCLSRAPVVYPEARNAPPIRIRVRHIRGHAVRRRKDRNGSTNASVRPHKHIILPHKQDRENKFLAKTDELPAIEWVASNEVRASQPGGQPCRVVTLHTRVLEYRATAESRP